MRTLFIILTLINLQALAVTKAPFVLRACFNTTDTVVTLSWNSITDGCGSFVQYNLYGNLDGGAYTKIAEIKTLGTTSTSFKVKSLKYTQEFYLSVLYLCDNQDSAISNSVKLDNIKPKVQELDSVSYDFTTQHIIAGWKPNPAPDTKKYVVYNHKSLTVNDSIGETIDTFFTVSTDPKRDFDVTLATLDSCLLSSPISDPHHVCVLSSKIDTCDRRIDLNWKKYKGWPAIDSQALFLSLNGAPFTHFRSFDGNASSFTLNNIMLGDTFCFFVRAFKANSSISSTSNRLCIETRAFHIPEFLYLRQVTVTPSEEIELKWEIESTQDIANFNLLRGTAGANRSSFNTITANSTSMSFTDATPDPNINYYSYEVVALNQCNEEVVRSKVSNSIFLDLDIDLSYNDYINWDGGVERYELFKKDIGGSTWNVVANQTGSGAIYSGDSSGCYYIVAYENLNSFGYSETSTSNIQCIEAELQVFIPTAMVMTGENSRFIVLGTGIDHEKSRYIIFNRWGEMIVENKTNVPWYGDYKGEQVMEGVYVFIVEIKGTKGQVETHKGTIKLIASP